MVFSSLVFLYWFLPIVIALYFIAPKPLKNFILLAFSLIFYFYGEQWLVLIMVLSTVTDYVCGLIIEKYRHSKKIPMAALVLSLAINLGLLGYFKYSNFFIENINAIAGAEIPLLNISLPIGISFYTFQTMSYTIDVYRGDVRAQKNILSFATFVTMFPQLVAGPIVRYSSIEPDLKNRTYTMQNLSYGVCRFVIGLAKKVMIANMLGDFGNVFSSVPDKSVLLYWLYAIAYTLQVYFDFSAYSDMAIGLGKIFGFSFPENFNYPFISKSISEFWRRWHISLGTWFRDYVYIPLGGNRVSTGRWLFNTFAVWFITGLWHGAAWNFIIWGLYFFVFLAAEKLLIGKLLKKVPVFFSHLYVLFFVVISFMIFNGSAKECLSGMFALSNLPFVTGSTLYYLKSYLVLFVISIVGATPLIKNLYQKIKHSKAVLWAEPAVITLLLILSTAYLAEGSFNPFLYFRF